MGAQDQFNAPVGQIAKRDVHVHNYWPESQPPEDPRMAVDCWQCKRPTWRYTERCVHCGVTLSPLRLKFRRLFDQVFGRDTR
jgi:hypothetical protein